MILTQADIDEFLNAYAQYEITELDDAPERFYRWLINNPQVLMAGAGFQEYVGAHKLPLFQRLIARGHLIDCPRPAFRTFEGQWLLISYLGSEKWDAYSLEGARHAAKVKDDEHEFDRLMNEAVVDISSSDRIIEKASQYVGNELVDATTFVSPQLWTPFHQTKQKDKLQSSATGLIRAIQQEKIDIQGVSWQELEEIVAEVLRAQGMEIHVVRDSPQGGRDIIARSELVPGKEVLTIAVEVKHRPFVNRPVLQQALFQNRHFPALMLVTSGRFSAGVIREAKKTDNRLRVFLKDGVAIRDLILSYGLTGLKRPKGIRGTHYSIRRATPRNRYCVPRNHASQASASLQY